MKSAVKLNGLILKSVLLYQVGIIRKFSQKQCKIQLPRYNLGEQEVLESALSTLSKSPKSKIFTTMVPPPKYTGFITNPSYIELLWGWNVCPLPLFFWFACPFLLHPNCQHLHRYILSSGALDTQISCSVYRGIQF